MTLRISFRISILSFEVGAGPVAERGSCLVGGLAEVEKSFGWRIGFADVLVGEQEFSDFVSDAENAISREHTLWIARRDRA